MKSVMRLWPLMIAGAALTSVAATAAPIAAPVPPPAEATLMRPLTLTKLEDMDFGNLAAVAAGTAVINPVTNTISATGGVALAGGTPHAARFAGATFSSAVVNIKIPTRSITLVRIGGTETMIVDNFTLDGQSKRTLANAGVFEFAVGATVHPATAQVEGVYTGIFDVTIQYP